MNKPIIIFTVAIAITIPSIIIFSNDQEDPELYVVESTESTENVDSEPDPEPSDCVGIKSSTDRLLCMKLNKILENQEVIFENQREIYDLISFWQEYISGMKRP